MKVFASIALTICVLPWMIPLQAQEQKPQVIAGWGEVVDPVGDCKFAEAGGVLSITVPGKHRDLNPLPGWNNLTAPRVLQGPVYDGDFVAQVMVRKFDAPKANTASNKEKPFSFVAGGLLVWKDDKNFVRLFRAANGDRGDVFVSAQFFSEGQEGAAGGQNTSDADTYLRITRTKGKFTLDESKNGTSWQARKPPGKDIVLDGKVKVGVAVVNATTKEITHQFEKLELKGK